MVCNKGISSYIATQRIKAAYPDLTVVSLEGGIFKLLNNESLMQDPNKFYIAKLSQFEQQLIGLKSNWPYQVSYVS